MRLVSPCSDSLSLRLPYSVKLATQRKSLTHYTKGTQSPQLDGSSRTTQAGVSFASLSRFRKSPLACSMKHYQPALGADRICFIVEVFGRTDVRQRTLRRPIKLGLPLFVCMRFQDLFHSPSGVLFAFPSRYWFTIGRSRVFSLGGWSPHLQTGFHVSRPTSRTLSSTPNLSRTGLSPSVAALSRALR
jgi:hypothetical protein